MKNKYRTLSDKFKSGFVILGIIILVACTGLGFYVYLTETQKIYNDTAYKIAYIARSYVKGDDFTRYLETKEADDAYWAVEADLTDLRSESGVNYIYVAKQEGINLTYVWDADNPYDDFEPFFIGDTGTINPKFEKDATRIVTEGVRVDNYFYSHSDFGYNTSAIVPLYDSEQNIVGIVGVEIAMEGIVEIMLKYIFTAILMSGALIYIVIRTYLKHLKKSVVEPINIMTGEANSFVKSKTEISGQLSEIKTMDEIEVLANSILTMEKDINSYIEDITAITKEKERIGAELDVAKHIQASMLPSIFPPFPSRNEFDIFASMNPAKEVGGDFYDFFMTDEDHLCLVIADVSGKGVPAALFMVISKTLIKNRASIGESPAQILENVNNQLCEGNEEQMFCTAWVGIYEISTGKMVCSSAGHEFPAIYRKSENSFGLLKDKHCFVLGGMEGMPYTEYELHFDVGDRLFVYTDGIPESINGSQEQFGTDRMIDTLNECTDMDIKEALEKMDKAVEKFADGEPQFDDMTMLMFEVKSR